MILQRDFYTRPDVVGIARNLLGKILVTRISGRITSGMITETEAYAGIIDRASHAYGNRNTGRTRIMYRIGGTAYIYFCYGVHSLFNVVTNMEGIPHAVLIRGVRPLEGIPLMLERTGKEKTGNDFTNGPGKVSKALGIHYSMSGTDLAGQAQDSLQPAIWIEDRGNRLSPESIIATPRIGVDYAGEDARLPYRFLVKING